MINPYIYTNNVPAFVLRQESGNKIWRRYPVEFPIAFPGIFQDSKTAYGEYIQSLNTGSAPLMILIHGWGDHSLFPLRYVAMHLVKQGMDCMLLYLPFHSRCLPEDMKKRSPNLSQDEWFAGYRIGVTDILQVVDWAGTQKRINTARIGVIGLSLGGFMGSIAMGIDDRIKAGVFLVSGGNSARISQNSRFSTFRRRYRLAPAEYEKQQREYQAYLARVEESGWENVEPSRQSFLIDPLTYARRLRERPVLMLNARWDEFIPAPASKEFQQACNCEISWFPATHSSIWLFYPLIMNKISSFLNSAFL